MKKDRYLISFYWRDPLPAYLSTEIHFYDQSNLYQTHERDVLSDDKLGSSPRST